MRLMVSIRELAFAISLLVIIVGSSGTCLLAEEPATVARIGSMGMGGVSVAVINDEDLFFSNPALLSWVEYPVFVSFDVKVGLSNDSIRFFKRLHEYYDGSSTKLSSEQVGSLNTLDPLCKLNGPLNIAYIRRHFGLGLFESSDLKTHALYHPASDKSSVQVGAQQTIWGVTSFAYGTELPPRWGQISVGMTLKYIARAEMSLRAIDEIADHGIIADIGRGFGLDIGILYRIYEKYAIGLMMQDAFGSQLLWENEYVKKGMEKKKFPSETEIQSHTTIGISFTPDWEIPYRGCSKMG